MAEQTVSREDAINAQMDNIQIMNQIFAEMKEIAVLPSEQPKDKSALQRVEFPDEGGILTYMEGFKQPYQGFPFYEFVDKIDLIKKVLRAKLSALYHQFKNDKVKFLFFLPSLFVARKMIYAEIYPWYRVIERVRVKSFLYSTPIRELHRAFSVSVPRETKDLADLRLMIRDLACMVLEFDNAYRYRFQDLMTELDTKAKNPIKELKRILDIAISREKHQEIKDTWRLLKVFFSLYLKMDRKMLALITSVMRNLNTDAVKITDLEKEYCEKRVDYTFSFMKTSK